MSVVLKDISLDPPQDNEVQENSNFVFGVPRFATQLFLIYECMLLSNWHICEKRVIIILILIIIVDKGSFLFLVSLIDSWGHLDNLIDFKSGQLKIFQIIDC